MFWRMAGLSTASPVETILDKDNFSLEELLDEDEIIQECKALNARLINFLRERPQVEQLVRYIVEEAPEDAEKSRNFKFPFISCEIFTCEIDIILRTLVEDEELLDLLFSFLDPNRPHSTLLAGYFSKVVTCLLVRKTVPLMNYIQAHREIIERMVDLIGITSIMEVMIRLVGADEHIYANYGEATKWLEDLDIIEMVVDKFSSSASPEVHSNAAEILCAIIRFAPSGLAARVSSPSFVGRLFKNALEESRPRSVLVNSLMVCICLLDPKRFAFGGYHAYTRQYAQGSSTAANPETVEGMLQNLGPLLKLLDVSSEGNVLLTTYGKLQPPLGRHRLKIVEFIAVLLSVGSEAAERELIQLGAVQRLLDMFFEYPYNNFLHHHVETIVLSCLESKSSTLLEHILKDCNLIWKILEADKNSTLTTDTTKPTVPFDGKLPPRLGNIGHITRISNKLVHLGNTRSEIQIILQENNEWVEWSSAILSKRNAVENVYQWACGRPTALHDRTKDSDDEDYQERDYDVAALANNLSQAFRYGIYSNELEEGHGSLERDDEDVYFDDESAEVVISSLRLGDDQEGGSLFTNSNWFAFEDGKINNDRSVDAISSASSGSSEETRAVTGVKDEADATTGGYDELDGATSSQEPEMKSDPTSEAECSSAATKIADAAVTDEPPEWVEWRETSSASEEPEAKFKPSSLENTSKSMESEAETKCEVSNDIAPATTDLSPYPDDPPVSDPGLTVGKTATTEGSIADALNQSMLSGSDVDIAVKDRTETSSAQHVLDNEKTEAAGNVAEEEAKEM